MKELNYITLIGLHVIIGLAIFSFPFLSKIYFIGILAFFSYAIFYSSPSLKGLVILKASGYIVGAEVLLRMTDGSFLYEASKYSVILFCLIGVLTMRVNRLSITYILYIVFLIPGILVAGFNMGEQTVIRKAIAFNLSGPVCLGIAAIFCFKRKISLAHIQEVLLSMALPLIAMSTYLFLFTPDLRDTITGTGSNYATSGGFGPNQVSTVLGIAMFIFSIRLFMLSPSLLLKLINAILLAAVSFRGIVTFSRGGVITALFMISAFIVLYFNKVNRKAKFRISTTVLLFASLGIAVWLISSIQTNGFIDKRYANEDALGREKLDITTGRSELIAFEVDQFLSNPIFGVGVGKIKELRFERYGYVAASHNEMSRILSEHGLFGIIAILILLITPLVLRMRNNSNIFFYSFYLFWLLTINHSSMRIAAPAFVYALCLLEIQCKNKNSRKASLKRLEKSSSKLIV
ncbi:O-antigen ligase family protein [Algibacter mikhailovii]|uniref:O-antigen ligase family protein n=1 Tax=Algibacter mikhailovii TaxID=425498 RepID=UPI002495572E|nr:O-antigen ligase family protein [Algibacter mikhailovii]